MPENRDCFHEVVLCAWVEGGPGSRVSWAPRGDGSLVASLGAFESRQMKALLKNPALF